MVMKIRSHITTILSVQEMLFFLTTQNNAIINIPDSYRRDDYAPVSSPRLRRKRYSKDKQFVRVFYSVPHQYVGK